MTKDEAKDFLRRNPKIAAKIEQGIGTHLEHLYLFAEASNKADSKVDVCAVIRALAS
jgi:hypothetical protein